MINDNGDAEAGVKRRFGTLSLVAQVINDKRTYLPFHVAHRRTGISRHKAPVEKRLSAKL